METYYQKDIEDIRREEYPTINGVTYLDHAGTTLYARSLIDRFSHDMKSSLFGNPHSASPSSTLSTVRVENVRTRLLRFFNADPEHFDLVFVANATAALKLVADAFRDVEGGFWYGYHRDAHTSVVGVRQLAQETRCFASDKEVDDWIQAPKDLPCETNLFAYPAQSNMNGHRTPLNWPGRIRASCRQKVYTLLDAAAYVMTGPLDLRDVEAAPDFTAMSFYKIFGFPDLGALIVRKSAGNILRGRRFFGGGTVDMVIALQKPWHAMKEHVLHEQLEDGTLPFHHIVALDSSLDTFEELYGSMDNVSRHTCNLARNLFTRLSSLRHASGLPVCHFYKDSGSTYGDAMTQGPTIAFNLRNAEGGWIGKSDVERLAILHGIHLRTGGVCNPGGIASFCALDAWEMRRNFSEGMRCGDDLDILGGKPTGIIRVSLGAMSSMDDVNKFVDFVQDMFVEIVDTRNTNIFAWSTTDALLENVEIFPIVGCSGFEVAKDEPWSIGFTGLEWNHEWCVVSTIDRQPLDPQRYPAMQNIRTTLDAQNGVLRLAVVPLADVSDPIQLSVPLWDPPSIPGDHTRPPKLDNFPGRPFDLYSESYIAIFFTRLLGTPSTLARFQHPRKVARSQNANNHYSSPKCISMYDDPASTISVLASVSSSSERHQETKPNIVLALPIDSGGLDTSRGPFFYYLRIGDHRFEIVDPISTESKDNISFHFSIRYIPSSYSCRSRQSQHPTVSTCQEVQFYNQREAASDPTIQAALESRTSCSTFLCPVWYCRHSFPTDLDLSKHLHTHVNVRDLPRHDTMQTTVSFTRDIARIPSPSTCSASSASTLKTMDTTNTNDTADTAATDRSSIDSISNLDQMTNKRNLDPSRISRSTSSSSSRPTSLGTIEEVITPTMTNATADTPVTKTHRFSFRAWGRKAGKTWTRVLSPGVDESGLLK